MKGKPVVPYNQRIASIFCDNCGGIAIAEISREHAATIAQQKVPVHCDKCVVLFAELKELEMRIEGKRATLNDIVRLQTEEAMKDIALLQAQVQLLQSGLNTIKQHQVYTTRWAAGNN